MRRALHTDPSHCRSPSRQREYHHGSLQRTRMSPTLSSSGALSACPSRYEFKEEALKGTGPVQDLNHSRLPPRPRRALLLRLSFWKSVEVVNPSDVQHPRWHTELRLRPLPGGPNLRSHLGSRLSSNGSRSKLILRLVLANCPSGNHELPRPLPRIAPLPVAKPYYLYGFSLAKLKLLLKTTYLLVYN